MRRVLLFDQANLLDYVKFMKWTEKLMKSRVEPAPPYYEKPPSDS